MNRTFLGPNNKVKKELRRTDKAFFIEAEHRVVEIKKSTKRKSATMTIAIDDDLADRLIQNAMVRMHFIRNDFAAVAVRLSWTTIDYIESEE